LNCPEECREWRIARPGSAKASVKIERDYHLSAVATREPCIDHEKAYGFKTSQAIFFISLRSHPFLFIFGRGGLSNPGASCRNNQDLTAPLRRLTSDQRGWDITKSHYRFEFKYLPWLTRSLVAGIRVCCGSCPAPY
jgi:hypothetical protein